MGFALAAPIGPIGIMIIYQTFKIGRWRAFGMGAGVAVADSMYGVVAGFGLSAISQFILSEIKWFKIFGGLLLIIMGILSYRKKPPVIEGREGEENLARKMISMFILAMTNPSTLIAFLAMMAALGLASSHLAIRNALGIVLGVFLGSLSWWFLLTYLSSVLKSKINPRNLHKIDMINGIVIGLLGVYILVSSVLK